MHNFLIQLDNLHFSKNVQFRKLRSGLAPVRSERHQVLQLPMNMRERKQIPMCMRERIHIPMCMQEIRNTNLNVRKYKYRGSGGEHTNEDRHASANTNITFAQDCKIHMKKHRRIKSQLRKRRLCIRNILTILNNMMIISISS